MHVPNVTLADKYTSMVNTLCKTELVDTSLKSTLQEIFHFQGQHVIELHAGLVEYSDAYETPNQSIAFEQTLRVFLIEGK